MEQRSEVIVEKFAQGITIRWKDVDDETKSSKALAVIGTESCVIGKEIWKEVSKILFYAPTDKVLVKIEYKHID